jgi:hypothetical protein
MDTPDPLPRDDLTDLELRLSGWTPSAAALNRDRMLFEAGRASARSDTRGRLTTALAASLAALAVGLGGWAVREHAQRRAVELALADRSRALEVALAVRPLPSEPASVRLDATAPNTYLALSHRLATAGVDVPEMPPAPPAHDQRPASPGRSLTPLSARRPGELMDL